MGARPGMPASLLLALAALSGCGSGHKATEDKVLYVYNWADYIGKDTLAKFERATGIKVVYDTYDADETLEAKLMAGDSGYDVVSTSTDFFSRQIKAGIYQPLDRSKLPNWGNLDPQALAAEAKADPGNRYAMPYLRHVNGFAYNVDMIKARMPDAVEGVTQAVAVGGSRHELGDAAGAGGRDREGVEVRLGEQLGGEQAGGDVAQRRGAQDWRAEGGRNEVGQAGEG